MRLLLAATALVLSGCNPSSPACTPGASVACVGVGGCSGGQVCRGDGSGFEACICSGADAGTDAGGDAGSDGGADAPTVDAPGDAGSVDDASDGGDPLAVCGGPFTTPTPECSGCFEANCCSALDACLTDVDCADCLTRGPPAGCSALADDLLACIAGACASECPM